jgi:dTDP-4-amino-4,6-dideoxygalactose transaminase
MPLMKVGRYNYPAQLQGGLQPLLSDIERMLLEGRYVLGEDVTAFEIAFADYLGASHAIGLNSGTDALVLALMALGIGRGDEVVTQANTFHATVAAICLVGATPVLVDVDEESLLMDPDRLPDVVTPATRAIIPVHLFGKPSPMGPILELARRLGLAVIEDAAQAHGARLHGRRVGSLGDAGCFSFHPSKNLAAAGDGGAVATSDPRIAEDIECRRSLGQKGQNHHVALGLNSKLDAIQARILLFKLSRLDDWNAERRRIAFLYRERLKHLPVSFQREEDGEEHVYHLFQLRTPRRDDLLEHLVRNGIEATIRYPTPIHRQPAFSHLPWRSGQFPTAERLANELLCLPLRPDMPDGEIAHVVDTVESFFGGDG